MSELDIQEIKVDLITEEMFDHPIWDNLNDFRDQHGGLMLLNVLGTAMLGMCETESLAEYVLFDKIGAPVVKVRRIEIPPR